MPAEGIYSRLIAPNLAPYKYTRARALELIDMGAAERGLIRLTAPEPIHSEFI